MKYLLAGLTFLVMVWIALATYWFASSLEEPTASVGAEVSEPSFYNFESIKKEGLLTGDRFVVKDGRTTLFESNEPIYFRDSDKYPVISRRLLRQLDTLASYISHNDNKLLSISCPYRINERNETEYANLGLARAKIVQDVFEMLEVDGSQLIISAHLLEDQQEAPFFTGAKLKVEGQTGTYVSNIEADEEDFETRVETSEDDIENLYKKYGFDEKEELTFTEYSFEPSQPEPLPPTPKNQLEPERDKAKVKEPTRHQPSTGKVHYESHFNFFEKTSILKFETDLNSKLSKIKLRLDHNPSEKVVLTGGCNDYKNSSRNRKMAVKRAETVRIQLSKLGVINSQIIVNQQNDASTGGVGVSYQNRS